MYLLPVNFSFRAAIRSYVGDKLLHSPYFVEGSDGNSNNVDKSTLQSTNEGLSAGAIVGIVAGTVIFIGLIVYIVHLKSKSPEQIIIDGSKTNEKESA